MYRNARQVAHNRIVLSQSPGPLLYKNVKKKIPTEIGMIQAESLAREKAGPKGIAMAPYLSSHINIQALM